MSAIDLYLKDLLNRVGIRSNSQLDDDEARARRSGHPAANVGAAAGTSKVDISAQNVGQAAGTEHAAHPASNVGVEAGTSKVSHPAANVGASSYLQSPDITAIPNWAGVKAGTHPLTTYKPNQAPEQMGPPRDDVTADRFPQEAMLQTLARAEFGADPEGADPRFEAGRTPEEDVYFDRKGTMMTPQQTTDYIDFISPHQFDDEIDMPAPAIAALRRRR